MMLLKVTGKACLSKYGWNKVGERETLTSKYSFGFSVNGCESLFLITSSFFGCLTVKFAHVQSQLSLKLNNWLARAEKETSPRRWASCQCNTLVSFKAFSKSKGMSLSINYICCVISRHVSHSQFCFCNSQSQCPKSHFPNAKIGKSQFPFYPFRALHMRRRASPVTEISVGSR